MQGGHAARQVQAAHGKQGGNHACHQGIQQGSGEVLQRCRHATDVRKQIEQTERQAWRRQRHADGIDHDGQHGPRQLRQPNGIQHQVCNNGCQHHGIPRPDGARARPSPRHPPRPPGAQADTSDTRHEQPGITGFRLVQQRADKGRRRGNVEEKTTEVARQGHADQQEAAVAKHFDIRAQQRTRPECLALGGWQGFWQMRSCEQKQDQTGGAHEPEDRPPSLMHLQEAPQDRGNRRGQRKPHGDLGHHALRGGPVVQVTDHGTSDDNASTASESLQEPPQGQGVHAVTAGASRRRDGEQYQVGQHHGAAAVGVRQGTVKQQHEGKCQQVQRQGLLQLQGGGIQPSLHGVKRGQVGVDRERRQHGHPSQQQRQEGQRTHGWRKGRKGRSVYRFLRGAQKRDDEAQSTEIEKGTPLGVPFFNRGCSVAAAVRRPVLLGAPQSRADRAAGR